MIKLEEKEEIVGEFKKHWWEIFVWGFSLSVLAILPAILLLAVKLLSDFTFSERAVYSISFFYTIWLSILWALFFIEWTDYYLDVWILTNHRIIDVDQKGLFYKDEATIRLEDITDLKIEFHGFIQSFLKFGSISVQSAGAHTEFVIPYINNPEHVRAMIYDVIEQSKRAKYD